jgi:Tfp pilus assembly protein PilV
MSRLKGNQGFVLADVTLGLFIISVALLCISMLFTQALQLEEIAGDYTLATNLAQKQLELLKNKSPVYWAELQLPCTIPWEDERFPPPADYELVTYAVPSTRGSHLVQVTVIVTWQERQKDYSIQLVTLYSKIN